MRLKSGAVEMHAPLIQIIDICNAFLVGRGALLV